MNLIHILGIKQRPFFGVHKLDCTLGNLKLWTLLTGGPRSEVSYLLKLKLGLSNGGLCRYSVVVVSSGLTVFLILPFSILTF